MSGNNYDRNDVRECDAGCDGSVPSSSDGVRLCAYCEIAEVMAHGDLGDTRTIHDISHRLQAIFEPIGHSAKLRKSAELYDLPGRIEALARHVHRVVARQETSS